MNKVKIKDVKTGVVKEVEQSLASDYVGTGKFEIYSETKEVIIEKPKMTFEKKNLRRK